MFPGMFKKGPKRASKVEEERLIQRAKKIYENPSMVIPKCQGSCFLCKFGKEKRWVKKLEDSKEDRSKLEKYSKKGPKLTRALASTMLLANQEKAKLLATANTPKGKISYAKRGNAGAKYLVGIQYFDDPFLRLMAYHDYSKKGYYIYSWNKELVCTDKKDAPPKGYINNRISSSNYRLKKDGNGYSCGHIGEDHTYFVIKWKTPGISIKVCEVCADVDSNLFIDLSSGITSPDNKEMFQLKGRYMMECGSDCNHCKVASSRISVKSSTVDKYFSGTISDKGLIDLVISENREALFKNSPVFAIGKKCFGKDASSFLNSLRYDDWEKDVLKKAIKLTGPVILEQGTVNELLEQAWDSYASDILSVLLDDEELIEELISWGDKKNVIPRDVLRQAKKRKMELDELTALPSFDVLPARARFVHDLMISYKISGVEEALNHLKEVNPRETRMKSLAYGFLHAIDRAESHRWKYDDSEVETGEFLSDYFKKLIESSGEEYAQALQDLLKMSGSTKTIVLDDGRELR